MDWEIQYRYVQVAEVGESTDQTMLMAVCCNIGLQWLPPADYSA
jgi:hypothetical protein